MLDIEGTHLPYSMQLCTAFHCNEGLSNNEQDYSYPQHTHTSKYVSPSINTSRAVHPVKGCEP